jgi:hypothetical protein
MTGQCNNHRESQDLGQVAALTKLSNELIRMSNPGAEAMVLSVGEAGTRRGNPVLMS